MENLLYRLDKSPTVLDKFVKNAVTSQRTFFCHEPRCVKSLELGCGDVDIKLKCKIKQKRRSTCNEGTQTIIKTIQAEKYLQKFSWSAFCFRSDGSQRERYKNSWKLLPIPR